MAYRNIANSFYTNGGVNYDLQWDNSTGLVQLIKHDAPAGTSPIFYDGHWVSGQVSALGINSADQKRIYNDIQSSVRAAYNNAGGRAKNNTIPTWSLAQNQGKNPGQQISTPPTQPGGFDFSVIGDLLTKPGDLISNVSSNGKDSKGNYTYGPNNEKDLFKSKTITYPIDLDTRNQDTLVIKQFHYTPPYANQLLTGNLDSILKSGVFRGSATRLEDIIGTVHFPMPSSLTEMKQVGWGDAKMDSLSAAALSDVTANPLQYLGAAAAGGATALATNIGAAIETEGLSAALGKGLNPGAMASGTTKLLMGTKMFGALSGTPEGKSAIGALGVNYLAKLTGFSVPVETILSRGAGVIPNENMELLFNNPALRVFSVSYRMTARSPDEADMIKLIIRFFKQGMSPKKRSGAAGGPSLFLATPNVFELRFMNGGRDIEGVSKFKTCALTSMQTDYTPDGFWVAYEKGQPVSTRITLSFAELEPIYDTDYQESVFAGRSDLARTTTKDGLDIGVKSTEVGY